VICFPDISLTLKSGKGYDYPKPNVVFEETTKPAIKM
jgi:hypothetical protein